MDRRLGMKERGLFLTLLSLPDNWEFSVIGLSKILPDGKAAIQTTVQKLEKLGYLKRVQAKGEKGKFAGYDWEIIPLPEEEAPLTENRSTAQKRRKSPLTENRSTDNRSTENPSTENQSQLNTKELNTKKSNIYLSNNQSINHSEEPKNPAKQSKKKTDRLIDRELIKDIKEQVNCEYLREHGIAEEDINLAVSIIAELYTATEPVVINNRSYTPEVAKRRSLQIEPEHIEYVFDCLNKQSERIYNIRAYLLTSIWNAPDTYSAYYTNAVRADGAIPAE